MAYTRVHGHNAVFKIGAAPTGLQDAGGDSNDISIDIAQESYDSTGYGVDWEDSDGGLLSFKVSAKIFNGRGAQQVTSIAVTTAGAGYAHTPTITIAAPTGAGGVTATAVAVVVNGSVSQINITNPGSGYLTAPTVTITVTGGDTASPVAVATASIGQYADDVLYPLLSLSSVYFEFGPIGSTSGKPKYTGAFHMTSYKDNSPLKGAAMIEFAANGKGTLAKGNYS
jgi:hypothetical protein